MKIKLLACLILGMSTHSWRTRRFYLCSDQHTRRYDTP